MEPYILKLPEAVAKGGKLTFIEDPLLPFPVQRVYWTYGLEHNAERGGHSHYGSDRIIVCVNGGVEICLEARSGQAYKFKLNSPSEVLYFPRQHWVKMKCSPDAILLTLASCKYEDDVYERDYSIFKKGL